MKENTPASHRKEAERQGRLAKEAFIRRDFRQSQQHLDRARELVLLALKLELDEPPTL